eukprot:TRINITY_DN17130_c0_g1_i3.p3 TRINITY_DN17130_c0_g1~~TRINITY_DN17130_c0_g1_i3.p3  ORF type:complete len:109 (+),score=19.39 TRINITY_DN17130_c0_g1_i3:150-476(+)
MCIRDRYNSMKGKAAGATPLGKKICDPMDVADSILWLASEEASYVSGEIMVMDGGQSLTTDLYEPHMKDMISSLSRLGSEQQHDKHFCLLYTSPSPRDLSTSRMPSSA